MSDVNEVSAQRENHINDFNNEDADAMAESMSADCITMPPHQAPIHGREATVAWIKQGMAVAKTSMTATPVDLVVAGDYAIDQWTWQQAITMTDTGETVHDSGNCLWIWRREGNNKWRVWRSIWNSDLEAQNIWTGAIR